MPLAERPQTASPPRLGATVKGAGGTFKDPGRVSWAAPPAHARGQGKGVAFVR